MPITVQETPSVDYLQSRWSDIVIMLEPLTDIMKEPYKSFFESPVKLLIGNKISLAIIEPSQMWSYIQDVEEIYSYLLAIDYLGYDLDFILFKICSFLSRLGLSMSIHGDFLLKGPMSQRVMHSRQELIGVTDRETIEELQKR